MKYLSEKFEDIFYKTLNLSNIKIDNNQFVNNEGTPSIVAIELKNKPKIYVINIKKYSNNYIRFYLLKHKLNKTITEKIFNRRNQNSF